MKKTKFGIWLEEGRQKRGMTQAAFGQFLGLSEGGDRSRASFYNQVITGRRVVPSRRIPSVARALEVPVEELTQRMHASSVGLRAKRKVGDVVLGVDDLEYLSGIVRGAGQPIPLWLLLEMLTYRSK